MKIPHTRLEKFFLSQGKQFIIGIDEAGRGPLAGPVVSAAVWIRNDFLDKDFEFRELVRDSKTLSEKQREKVYEFLKDQEGFYVGIGQASCLEIDERNILQATFLSAERAFYSLIGKIQSTGIKYSISKTILLMDGNQKIPDLAFDQETFSSGDANIFSISLASIFAKVHRDRLMNQYHQQYPVYGFDRHRGYGTAFHIQQLQKHGSCKIHRRSFAPVKNYYKKQA